MQRDWSWLKTVLIGAGAILYGASPIDIIPDWLVPLGFGDDAIVLVGAAVAIWRVWRNRANRRAGGTPPPAA